MPEYLWWVWSEQLKVLGEFRFSVPNLVDKAMAVSFLFLSFVLLVSILFFALNVWLSAWLQLAGRTGRKEKTSKVWIFCIMSYGA